MRKGAMEQISRAGQDYLKALFVLESDQREGRDEPVGTTTIAQHLEVTPASATSMLKKLEMLGLVTYLPYRGASLTPAGAKLALEVIRHHRLIETYLAEALGVPWDEVHAEAEILEHAISEELEERISAHLGHPTEDPHGHPIPAKDGTLPRSSSERRLWALQEGESTAVGRVPDHEAEALRYLDRLGIRPGARLEVVGRGPVAGPLFVRVEGQDDEVRALSKELAETVWVS
jgi:DtxR family transcriptional regulator, Mn-dependent transcriptional regulator